MQAKQLAQESALALYYGSTKVIVSMPEQSLHSNKEGGSITVTQEKEKKIS